MRGILREEPDRFYKLFEKFQIASIKPSPICFGGQILPKHFHLGDAPFYFKSRHIRHL